MEMARATGTLRPTEVACDDNGRLLTVASGTSSPPLASTSSPYNVADATTSQILAVTNLLRKGFMLENDSIYNLYLKLGTTASLTSYTVKITPYGWYEMSSPIYTGPIDGIWDGDQSGFARVTELS